MTSLYDNLDFNKRILLDLPFREGVGIVTQDVAKPHHPITMHDTPTWASLDSGLGVLDLNGTSEYLQCLSASCADLDFTTGDYSLGGWFYLESGGAADDLTLLSRFLLNNNGWELYHYTNAILTLRHHHAATPSPVFGRSSAYSRGWAFNKWWFMGVSRSGASAQFYRGDTDSFVALLTTGTLVDPETGAQNLLIGTDPTGDNDYNGPLWRPRVWDVALTEEDWRTIYELEKGWFV